MQKEEIQNYLNKVSTEIKLRGLSKRTIESYSFFLTRYLQTLNKPAEQATEQDVKNFLAQLVDSYSSKSRALATSSLRFLYKEILDKPEIIIKIKNPKKQETLPTVLTKEEVQNLINSAETRKSKLLILFLYSTGVRVSELVNLKINDIEMNSNIGTVRGKGDKQRQIYIGKSLSEELKQYIQEHSNNIYLFSETSPLTPRNIQKIIKKAAKKAQIQKKVTPHTLRHSYATHHLQAGTDIRKIQMLLGHARIDTTQIYTNLSNKDLENLKNPADDMNLNKKPEENGQNEAKKSNTEEESI